MPLLGLPEGPGLGYTKSSNFTSAEERGSHPGRMVPRSVRRGVEGSAFLSWMSQVRILPVAFLDLPGCAGSWLCKGSSNAFG